MKVESITISLGRTLNTGNFESYRVKVGGTFKADDEKGLPAGAWGEAFEVVDAELKSRVKAAKEKLERIRGAK